ncbi:hypothetical protein [Bogoriella caseilytica]|uniref:Uncharacterized protein n=1 Tax=Bogoriella caseilytica TaxID=56055 RepID=A0A3N2B9U6_9MICO|nr:hypothetical protein [Bogoriella caseilytica]ROR72050.1 hypothetical protein EDD31_0396 [Bogoriella caseilytica]
MRNMTLTAAMPAALATPGGTRAFRVRGGLSLRTRGGEQGIES